MNTKRILFILFLLTSLSALAGKVTIEKKSSLYRNDLFDQKRLRAEEYKRKEAKRNLDNERWSTRLDPSCALLRFKGLIYMCAEGRFYQGYRNNGETKYRELSAAEIKKIEKILSKKN